MVKVVRTLPRQEMVYSLPTGGFGSIAASASTPRGPTVAFIAAEELTLLDVNTGCAIGHLPLKLSGRDSGGAGEGGGVGVSVLSLSPTAEFVAYVASGTVHVCSWQRGRLWSSSDVSVVAFSSKGFIAVGSLSGRVRIRDVARGAQPTSFEPFSHSTPLCALQFIGDGKNQRLFSMGSDSSLPDQLSLLDLSTWLPRRYGSSGVEGATINSACLSKGIGALALACGDGYIRLMAMESGAVVSVLSFSGTVGALALSDSGALVACNLGGKVASVWQVDPLLFREGENAASRPSSSGRGKEKQLSDGEGEEEGEGELSDLGSELDSEAASDKEGKGISATRSIEVGAVVQAMSFVAGAGSLLHVVSAQTAAGVPPHCVGSRVESTVGAKSVVLPAGKKGCFEATLVAFDSQSSASLNLGWGVGGNTDVGDGVGDAETWGVDGFNKFGGGTSSGWEEGAELREGDTIGAAADLVSGRLWFAINGKWREHPDFELKSEEIMEGLQPLLTMSHAVLSINLGDRPFLYPPRFPEMVGVHTGPPEWFSFGDDPPELSREGEALPDGVFVAGNCDLHICQAMTDQPSPSFATGGRSLWQRRAEPFLEVVATHKSTEVKHPPIILVLCENS